MPFGGDSRNEASETLVSKPLTNDIDAGPNGTIVMSRNQVQHDVTNIGTGPQYHQPMHKISSHLGGPIPPPFVINTNNGYTDVKGTVPI